MKAIVAFQKLYPISMCSHLDLQRIFGRAFRRAGLPVEYSKGFNPHPELSFALPLSLGFEGEEELLEVGVSECTPEEDFLNRLNAALPKGLSVYKCVFAEKGPSLASMVGMADYRITVVSSDEKKLEEACKGFLREPSVTMLKPPKNKPVDIRPAVHDLCSEGNKIFARLSCGNESLNPKLLISALRYDIVSVVRAALMKKDGEPLFNTINED